jgi:hypothetical protein
LLAAYRHILATLPGFTGPTSYASWPIWSDSARAEVRFQPMPKKAATRLWHRARDFDRQTRQKDRHGGKVGHSALQVLHALIFDFLNFRTGQLDPSYAAIARKANVCERTVATAIQRLKGLGILNWVLRHGVTAGTCWSRTRTPTPCCPRHSGGATASHPRRRGRRPAPGEIIRQARTNETPEIDR